MVYLNVVRAVGKVVEGLRCHLANSNSNAGLKELEIRVSPMTLMEAPLSKIVRGPSTFPLSSPSSSTSAGKQHYFSRRLWHSTSPNHSTNEEEEDPYTIKESRKALRETEQLLYACGADIQSLLDDENMRALIEEGKLGLEEWEE